MRNAHVCFFFFAKAFPSNGNSDNLLILWKALNKMKFFSLLSIYFYLKQKLPHFTYFIV